MKKLVAEERNQSFFIRGGPHRFFELTVGYSVVVIVDAVYNVKGTPRRGRGHWQRPARGKNRH